MLGLFVKKSITAYTYIMIASLKGTILQKKESAVVLDVHGVGYEVALPRNELAECSVGGELRAALGVEGVGGVCVHGGILRVLQRPRSAPARRAV